MMKRVFAGALALELARLAGAAGIAAEREDPARTAGALVVDLRATSYNKGGIGQAILLPQGGQTRVVLRFSGVPPYVSMPVHVYTYVYAGSCASLPTTPAWSLKDRVLAERVAGSGGPRGMMQIAHVVPVPLADLREGHYAIALRTAPADGDQMIFCGDLGPRHS